MPSLVSMKLTPSEAKDEMAISETPRKFPWGLSINLEDESLKKLEMALPEVGSRMHLAAVVVVESVRASATTEGKDESVSLQIEELGLEPIANEEGRAERLFGSDKGEK